MTAKAEGKVLLVRISPGEAERIGRLLIFAADHGADLRDYLQDACGQGADSDACWIQDAVEEWLASVSPSWARKAADLLAAVAAGEWSEGLTDDGD